MATLLIEVFTEELPAHPLLRTLDSIITAWRDILKTHNLESKFDFYYTPRRLVLIHENFATHSPDRVQEIYGAPLNIAYNADKSPSNALKSFLSKNDISLDSVSSAMKDGKEVLYCKKVLPGVESRQILSEMVEKWLKSLNFGKAMRWGDVKDSFIRPIRNICILLDSEFIPCDIFGLISSNEIKSHRQALNASKNIESLQDYLTFLKNNGVILDQKERKDRILSQMQNLQNLHSINVELDSNLLDEIVAITEYPSALLGEFEERFLRLPKEMIITSMKENQRYFAVSKNDKLYNGFIVVSNAFVDDFSLIILGNQKVLKARLHDAEFFYNNDLESKMNFGSLSEISFMQGAGSLSDKVEREKILANNLIDLLIDSNVSENERKIVIESLEYAKRDLLSQSVGEFPELQGIMGAYFAKDLGLDDNVCRAIKEQYLPNGIDSNLPSKLPSAIVNLAIKLDNIFTLFSLKKIPSGSKDPFSLRRQAAGLLKICHHFDLDISINSLLALKDSVKYSAIDSEILRHFIIERMYGIFSHINPSIVRSVLVRDFGVKSSFDKILALACYLDSVDIKSVISTFKRVANILDSIESSVDTSLFEPSESELYTALEQYKSSLDLSAKMDSESYLAEIQNLFKLKEKLDKVFDNVLINTPDTTLRKNRTALISLVFEQFLSFADLREISL